MSLLVRFIDLTLTVLVVLSNTVTSIQARQLQPLMEATECDQLSRRLISWQSRHHRDERNATLKGYGVALKMGSSNFKYVLKGPKREQSAGWCF